MTSLKLTWRRQADTPSANGRVDLAVTVDPATTIGALADAILVRDAETRHHRPIGPATLAVIGPDGRVSPLNSQQSVRDSGLGSGATVAIVDASPNYVDARLGQDVVVLRVTEGPDAGASCTLRAGIYYLGRDDSNSVVFTDPRVSLRHARITVGADLVIEDSGSTNGTYVNGGKVSRAQMGSGDTIGLGYDTLMSVAVPGGMLASNSGPDRARGEVSFNRSPRLDPRFKGTEHEAPKPPRRPSARRFPFIPMLAPLILGTALFLITGSLFSLVFIALSPLLVVGSYAEDAIANRRAFVQAQAEFEKELALLTARLHDEAQTEVTRRRAEHPATAELVAAAMAYEPLLWIRRPEHDTFLDLRLGIGRQPSRTSVKLPTNLDAPAHLVNKLSEVVDAYSTVDNVPIVARLTECGGLGIAEFQPPDAPRTAAAIVAQLVALHSPAELILTAVLIPADTRTTGGRDAPWGWLKWLPHTSPHPLSPHTPLRCPHLTTGGPATVALLSELDDVIEQRAARTGSSVLPAVVLLVSDDAAGADRARMVSIAERGREYGVFVIWLAARVERLPAVCRTFLHIDGTTQPATVGYVERPHRISPVAVEALSLGEVDAVARRLAPVIDAGARADDESGLPTAVSFLELAQAPLNISSFAVQQRWAESASNGRSGQRHEPTLGALVGARGPGEIFELDLCEHGPHALVGGTTGSGKSEFLQSWILGMATKYSPRRVTFLLVDYKGGSAFGPCSKLPHAVGLVTDLTPHLITRVLRSLKAELKRREELLEAYKTKDLTSLERISLDAAPPRLVIVVDEFYALSKDAPEFVDEMVDIAQRGRSLGLHLILATQRPTGVITDNLRANTNLRIALRMADQQDSVDVLGTATAASFDPAIPGRAVAKTGPGRLVTFQSAFAGGWTTNEPPPPEIVVRSLPFSLEKVWEQPEYLAPAVPADPGPTDVVRIVERIVEAFGYQDPPTPPWLEALKPPLDLRKVLEKAPGELVEEARRQKAQLPRSPLVYGRRDLPDSQAQPPAYFDPDASANLAVLGTGGSGKTTLLRTLAISAVHEGAGPCHIYGIDFGTWGLDLLAPLRHVAPIVQGQDGDRVARLFSHIRGIIDQRNLEFSRLGANTIARYWELKGLIGDDRWVTPRVLLLIDGMGSFTQQYQPGVSRAFDSLLRIASDGRKCGVHVIITADRGGAVPSSLMSAMQTRVVLRLASNDEYAPVGAQPGVLDASSPPGAGMVGKDVVQVATYGDAADDTRLRDLVEALATRYAHVPPAQVISTWDDQVTLTDLARAAREMNIDAPFVGRGSDLEPVRLPTRGYFVVTGGVPQDRAHAVAVLAAALRTWRPDIRLHYLGQHASDPSQGRLWSSTTSGNGAVRDRIDQLVPVVSQSAVEGATPMVVVVEAFPELVASGLATDLENLVTAAVLNGHLVVVDGDPTAFNETKFPLLQTVRSSRSGLVLKPQFIHGSLFGASFSLAQRSDWPPGRGLVVDGGEPKLVQLALPG